MTEKEDAADRKEICASAADTSCVQIDSSRNLFGRSMSSVAGVCRQELLPLQTRRVAGLPPHVRCGLCQAWVRRLHFSKLDRASSTFGQLIPELRLNYFDRLTIYPQTL